MLPALTFNARRRPSRRLVAAIAGAGLTAISVVASLGAQSPGTAAPTQTRLRERLAPSTWALALPLAWLDAPVASMESGDTVDLLAVRAGDKGFAIPIAADLLVMQADDRAVVLEVDEESAAAIATARGSSLLLIPLLRSRR